MKTKNAHCVLKYCGGGIKVDIAINAFIREIRSLQYLSMINFLILSDLHKQMVL